MDDLTTLELYVLDRISHFSYEVMHLLSRSKLTQIDQRFLNEYKSYVHTYREILFYIRRLKEQKNNGSDTGEDNSEET